MTFAQNFERICNEKGVSRTALVTSLGLSSSKVTYWQHTVPKYDVMVKLANALHCDVSDFFIDPSGKQPVSEPAVLTDDESEIIDIFRSLSRRQQHEFMTYCYSLATPSTD